MGLVSYTALTPLSFLHVRTKIAGYKAPVTSTSR